MKLTAIALFLICGAAELSAAQQNYLPSVGPNPLRFGPVIPASLPPGTFSSKLAAPELSEPPSAPLAPLAPMTPMTPDSAKPVQASPVPSGTGAAPTPGPTPAPTPAPMAALPQLKPSSDSGAPFHMEAPQAMTPQMLLHYFRPAGGTNESVVSLPVLFTPPVPALMAGEASSRATYATPAGPVAGPGARASSAP